MDEAQKLLKQAADLRADADRLERLARDVEEGPVIQVEFESSDLSYAYRTGGLTVHLGEQVLVRAPGNSLKLVTVVAFGRGEYTGPLKTIVGKVTQPDDPTVFEDYRDSREDQGFGFCPDCGFAYSSADQVGKGCMIGS